MIMKAANSKSVPQTRIEYRIRKRKIQRTQHTTDTTSVNGWSHHTLRCTTAALVSAQPYVCTCEVLPDQPLTSWTNALSFSVYSLWHDRVCSVMHNRLLSCRAPFRPPSHPD